MTYYISKAVYDLVKRLRSFGMEPEQIATEQILELDLVYAVLRDEVIINS
jgi:hypothetical protein